MLNKYLVQCETDQAKDWVNHNLRNYIDKSKNEDQGEIEHIIDFFNSDAAPKRLNRMSYDEAKASAEKWLKALQKKGNGIVETDEDIQTFMDFGDGFRFVELKGQAAFQREGNMMGHCVASYYGKSESTIYSLRDTGNNPHCTVEVLKNSDQVQQIKGKGNGPIHPKYINYVVQFLEKVGMEVRDSELENLGYTNLSSIEGFQEFVDKNFEGARYMYLRGNKYFYNYSRLASESEEEEEEEEKAIPENPQVAKQTMPETKAVVAKPKKKRGKLLSGLKRLVKKNGKKSTVKKAKTKKKTVKKAKTKKKVVKRVSGSSKKSTSSSSRRRK